jgi:hypothetical protein
VSKALEEALGELGPFYGVGGSNDFIKSIMDAAADPPPEGSDSATNASPTAMQLLKLITSPSEAAYGIKPLTMKIAGANLVDDLRDFVCITPYEEGDVGGDKANLPLNTPTAGSYKEQGLGEPAGGAKASYTVVENLPGKKPNPGCPTHVFQLFKVGAAPSTSDTEVVSIFLNSIPTIEMSRAQPYIDIMLSAPVTDGTKTTRALSLGRFLIGTDSTAIAAGGAVDEGLDNILFGNDPRGTTTNVAADDPSKVATHIRTLGGMELFTSPQTMVPLSAEIGSRAEKTPGIDRFRPFMSLNSLTINVQPGGGAMAFKEGSISLILHDRARLGDITPLVCPSKFGTVKMEITYGWSHPDGGLLRGRLADSQENRYGALINAMRVTETFQVYQTSYSFDESGGIAIDAQISVLGAHSASVTDITASAVADGEKELDEIFERIKRGITAIGNKQRAVGKISIHKHLQSSTNLHRASRLSTTEIAALKKHLAPKAKKDPQYANILEDVNKLYSAKGKYEKIKNLAQLTDTKAQALERMYSSLKKTTDPFLRFGLKYSVAVAGLKKLRTKKMGRKGIRSKRVVYVTLGKLMSVFVTEALASNAEFEECHLLFYPFNDSAGAMFAANIAQFPIPIAELTAILKQRFKVTTSLSVANLFKVINLYFLRDQGTPAYGFSSLYEQGIRGREKTDEGQYKTARKRTAKTKENEAMNDARVARLRTLYGLGPEDPGVTFKLPQVTMRFDSRPRIVDEGGTIDGHVLRIHVFDEQCGKGEQLKDVLDAFAGNGSFAQINRTEPPDSRSPGHSAVFKAHIKALEDREPKLIKPADTSSGQTGPKKMMLTEGSFGNLKQFFRQNFPSILYGSATSNVISAEISTMEDDALSSAMMTRQNNASIDQGVDHGFPLKILPTQLSMTILGCPFVKYTQQYFVDFGSNSTADNFYGINGIGHEISSEGFTTTLDLVQIDGFGKFESAADKFKKVITDLENAASRK